MTIDTALDVAARWRRAVEVNDIDAFRDLYTTDAEVWTNLERAAHPVDVHIRRVATARQRCDSWTYLDVTCQQTESGFLSEHVVHVSVDGHERTAVAAVVAELRDGRIARLREYLEPATTTTTTTTTTRGAPT